MKSATSEETLIRDAENSYFSSRWSAGQAGAAEARRGDAVRRRWKDSVVEVDNLRHDVVLSPRFVELGRAQIARLIARHGELEGLLSAEVVRSTQGPAWMRNQAGRAAQQKNDPSGWKSALAELQVGSLNRAKKESRLSVDLLARLAVTKFVRTEMNQQFLQVLERCRVLLKSYDNMRQEGA